MVFARVEMMKSQRDRAAIRDIQQKSETLNAKFETNSKQDKITLAALTERIRGLICYCSGKAPALAI